MIVYNEDVNQTLLSYLYKQGSKADFPIGLNKIIFIPPKTDLKKLGNSILKNRNSQE